MKSPAAIRFALALVLAGAAASLAPAALAEDSALDSLIAAEREFAKSAADTDTKSAFLGHLADDAVIFRPGPVNGVRTWRDRVATDALLEWAPDFAEVSGNGDLGFTSGPWAWTAKRGGAPSAFGTFVTVWRRTHEGTWKVVLDHGVSHEGSHADLDATVTRGPFHARPDSAQWRKWDAGVGVRSGHASGGVSTAGIGIGLHSGGLGFGFGSGGVRSRQDYEWRRTAHEKNELMNEERRLAFEAKTHGWEAAYRAVAAGDLRFLREGAKPDLGIDGAIAGSAAVPRNRDVQSRGNGVATSWDLGYDYGIAIAPVKGARPDTSAWVHLWRKDDAGKWKLMVDVETPFPKR